MQVITKYFSDFTPQQLQQIAALEPLYTDWNSKINVISRKDMDGLYEKHVLHSLCIAAIFDFEPGMEIIDIGTGGGFPGIPLAIFFPEVRFHLVDSIAKKLKVVNAVAEAAGIKNITTQQIRAEEIKGRKFDFVVSRAVAPLKELWKWSRPLLKRGQERFNQHSHKGVADTEPPENPRWQPEDSELPIPGLICLKGGDLTHEIYESRTRPRILEISEIFQEEYFKQKYLLYVSR